jgi:hypothetical protein
LVKRRQPSFRHSSTEVGAAPTAAVTVGVTETAAVGVRVAVAVTPFVGVRVAVTLLVGVRVGVAETAMVGVRVAVAVTPTVEVRVGVGVGWPKATVAPPSIARKQTLLAIVFIIETPFAASPTSAPRPHEGLRTNGPESAVSYSSEWTYSRWLPFAWVRAIPLAGPNHPSERTVSLEEDAFPEALTRARAYNSGRPKIPVSTGIILFGGLHVHSDDEGRRHGRRSSLRGASAVGSELR